MDKVTEIRKLFDVTCNAMLQRLRDPDAGIQSDLCWLLDGVIAVVCRTDDSPLKRTEVFVGDKMLMFYPDRLTQVKVGQAFFVGQKPYTVVKVGVTDYEVRIECTALNTNTKRMDNTAPNNGMPAGETTTSSFLSNRMEKVD